MRTITCFGDRTIGTFLIIALVNNFVSVNVFNSVTSPHVLPYHCVFHYFLTNATGL